FLHGNLKQSVFKELIPSSSRCHNFGIAFSLHQGRFLVRTIVHPADTDLTGGAHSKASRSIAVRGRENAYGRHNAAWECAVSSASAEGARSSCRGFPRGANIVMLC